MIGLVADPRGIKGNSVRSSVQGNISGLVLVVISHNVIFVQACFVQGGVLLVPFPILNFN